MVTATKTVNLRQTNLKNISPAENESLSYNWWLIEQALSSVGAVIPGGTGTPPTTIPIRHDQLLELGDDDHLQYFHLNGRTGGQIIYGLSRHDNILQLRRSDITITGGGPDGHFLNIQDIAGVQIGGINHVGNWGVGCIPTVGDYNLKIQQSTPNTALWIFNLNTTISNNPAFGVYGGPFVGSRRFEIGWDGSVQLYGTTSTSKVQIKAAVSTAAYNLILPSAQGTALQVLRQSAVVGTLEWATPSVGYGNEEAQDAVGSILVDSSTIDFTYNDATPSITASVIIDSIGNTLLRDSVGVSVIGRSANSTGDPADIVAASDNQFLVRRASVLGFGGLVAGDIPDLSATYSLVGHIHAAADITSGIFNIARIPDLSGTYSLLGHVHSAADITSGILSVARGGTGQSTSITAFNALSPLTTLGDLLTNDGTNDIRFAHPGVTNRVLRTTATVPTWDIGDIYLGGYMIIAMSCDHGSSLPGGPASSQWFRHITTGRDILYQYDSVSSTWKPIISFSETTFYVDIGLGTNVQGNGTAAGASAYRTRQYAIDQIPPFVVGSVVINLSSGTYSADVTIDGKSLASGSTITIAGVSGPLVNSCNLTTSGGPVVLGSNPPAVQSVIKLTTAGPAEAVVGGIIQFTSGANNGQIRVIGAVSTTTNANDTLQLVGNPLSAFAAANADTVAFHPLTTNVTGSITIGPSQAGVTVQYIKFTGAGTGPLTSKLVVKGKVSVVLYCMFAPTSGYGVYGKSSQELTIAWSGFAMASSSASSQFAIYGESTGFIIAGCLLTSTSAVQDGFAMLYGSTAVVFVGTVFDNLRRGITGLPASVTFFPFSMNVIFKRCTDTAINGDTHQLVTSGIFLNVTFGTGGNANVTDVAPYAIETTQSIRRTVVSAGPYTALSTDDVIAYIGTVSATINLLDASVYGDGKVLTFKKETGTTGITLSVTSGSANIEDVTTMGITSTRGFLRLYTDGTSWFRIGFA